MKTAMKTVIYLRAAVVALALAVSASAGAQIRTYSDIDSESFVIGLDQYYFGEAGSLAFKVGTMSCRAEIAPSGVILGAGRGMMELELEDGDVIVGIHDFTGDNLPEAVAAVRTPDAIIFHVYKLEQGTWIPIGRIGATGEGVTEVRVFRQAVTIRDKKAGALYTWTFHGDKFDFKSSSGKNDPTP